LTEFAVAAQGVLQWFSNVLVYIRYQGLLIIQLQVV